MKKSPAEKSLQPKTELDRQFLALAEKSLRVRGIATDRAMSIALEKHPDFIGRVRKGIQSATADAWETLRNKFPVLVESSTTNVMSQGGGQAVGTNHGTAIGSLTLDDCQRDLVAAQKEIALLTSQLADKERTIQILLKQTSS